VRHVFKRFSLAIGLASAIVACGSDNPASPSQPATTESFSGSLVTSGVQTHTFAAGKGSVAITLVSLSPSGIYVGIGFGTWDGTKCTVAAVNETVLPGGGLLGSVTSTSTVCIKVYDVGYIAAGTTYAYSVQALHY
jgi:hypothetical protein